MTKKTASSIVLWRYCLSATAYSKAVDKIEKSELVLIHGKVMNYMWTGVGK